jgi:hypothetical protein
MKCIISAILTISLSIIAFGQKIVLTTDTTLLIPKLSFDAAGELVITPSASSSVSDFDFLVGKWNMHHRKLNKRFENCKDWTEFESTDENHKILNGVADVDILSATMDGRPFEGFTLRLFNPKTRLWSLYWVASNVGVLDPPVVGSFENNVGHFFTKDTFNGKKIIMMFRWDKRDKDNPVWSQAFSADNGKTWEWNWYNVSHRIQ